MEQVYHLHSYLFVTATLNWLTTGRVHYPLRALTSCRNGCTHCTVKATPRLRPGSVNCFLPKGELDSLLNNISKQCGIWFVRQIHLDYTSWRSWPQMIKISCIQVMVIGRTQPTISVCSVIFDYATVINAEMQLNAVIAFLCLWNMKRSCNSCANTKQKVSWLTKSGAKMTIPLP